MRSVQMLEKKVPISKGYQFTNLRVEFPELQEKSASPQEISLNFTSYSIFISVKS